MFGNGNQFYPDTYDLDPLIDLTYDKPLFVLFKQKVGTN